MKKRIFSIVFLLIFISGSAFTYTYKKNEKEYIGMYKRAVDIKTKIFLVKKLTAMKSIEALKMFVDDLCFPLRKDTPSGDLKASSGRFNLVRKYIAFYLRYYRNEPKENLFYGFQVIRKLVDNSPDEHIVIHAMTTLCYWAKNMEDGHKSLMVNSLNKKISKIDKKYPRMTYAIIRCIRILLPYEGAKKLIYRMRAAGLNNRAKRMLRKLWDPNS